MLHERAADWFEAQGDPACALDHALAGGDADRAARLLSALALRVYHDGRLGDLAVWLERFAAIAPLDEHPAAAVLAGWVHALAGRMHQAEQASGSRRARRPPRRRSRTGRRSGRGSRCSGPRCASTAWRG